MSKLFKWFKKDKPSDHSEQDGSAPTSSQEAEIAEQLKTREAVQEEPLEEAVSAPQINIEDKIDNVLGTQSPSSETTIGPVTEVSRRRKEGGVVI